MLLDFRGAYQRYYVLRTGSVSSLYGHPHRIVHHSARKRASLCARQSARSSARLISWFDPTVMAGRAAGNPLRYFLGDSQENSWELSRDHSYPRILPGEFTAVQCPHLFPGSSHCTTLARTMVAMKHPTSDPPTPHTLYRTLSVVAPAYCTGLHELCRTL